MIRAAVVQYYIYKPEPTCFPPAWMVLGVSDRELGPLRESDDMCFVPRTNTFINVVLRHVWILNDVNKTKHNMQNSLRL
jgi:hypothetical protein